MSKNGFFTNAMVKLFGNERMNNDEQLASLHHVIARPIALAGMVIVATVIFFIAWGGTAPIDSAAIAPGTVTVESKRKTIQHLEGGIIEEFFISEGDVVEPDQLLIRLNETAAKAKNDLLKGQYLAAKALEDRLIAQRDGKKELVFSPEVLAADQQPEVIKQIDTQRRLFATYYEGLDGQVSVLEQQISQYQKQLQGIEAQISASKEQRRLLNQEIAAVKELLAQGLAEKPRLLGLQRNYADIGGREGEYLSTIARTGESITETKMEIYNIQNEFLNRTVGELDEVQKQLADLQEQLFAAKDILARTVITSPIHGKVTGLNFHTIGGVISPGAAIMDIVPLRESMVVEARVSPQDIDVVHEGLQAKVMLSAYRARYVPRLSGTVIGLSADRFTDDVTGEAYFTAKVRINDGALERLTEAVELYPGMPAEVFIVTGSRTLLGYLFSPIRETMHRAFKEQ